MIYSKQAFVQHTGLEMLHVPSGKWAVTGFFKEVMYYGRKKKMDLDGFGSVSSYCLRIRDSRRSG